MALNAYDELHNEVYDEVYSFLERKDREDLRFAPLGTAEQVLHADKLRRLFDSLLDYDQTTLIERVGDRRLHQFLAALLVAGCSLTTARIAVAKLIASDGFGIGRKGTSIASLPADKEDLQRLFDGNAVDADKFLGKQAYFCPVVIRSKEESKIEDTQYRRLPYLEEQSLQKGSFGHVFRVKIAKGHFYDPVKGTENSRPVELARKDYELSKDFDAAAERETMEKILASSAWDCPNILRNLGSLAFGPTVYSLFMPLAICDLRAYMTKLHENRPNSIEEKTELLRCAMGLAGGLHFLHNEMKTSDMEHLVCYHMDLKPSNILIFRETGRSGKVRNIWKLSDFGMSRMKIRHSENGLGGERDVNRWFIRRPEPEDPSLSGTLNRRGEGTYLAPESLSPSRTMKTQSDVWSLGCVLSVLFAYMEDGDKGVKDYAEERFRHDAVAGYDRFFVLSRGFNAAKPNPGIKKRHSYLVERAGERGSREGGVINSALQYIEAHVLQVDQSKRKDAKEVASMLEDTFRAYLQLSTDSHSKIANGPGDSHHGSARRKIFSRISCTLSAGPQRNVEKWWLSETEAFKGCQASPDCSFVAYWTDRKILLYSAQSLNSARGDTITSVGQYSLEREDRFWNTIRLTDRYLVASTTSATFHCYIFDLEEEGSLNRCYSVTLPLPAITKLAISPDSQTVACALRSSEDDRDPGSLLVLYLTETLRKCPRQCSIPVAPSLADITEGPRDAFSANFWWKRTLNWPAGNISRMSFSTSVDIYFVVGPELTVPRSRNIVFVVHINIETRDLHYLPIEARGLETGNTARLFTALAPFHAEPTLCTLVTREKRLHIHNMAAKPSFKPIQQDIKNYRVLKLLAGLKDDKLYAVARQSANHRMLLVVMTVPRSNTDVLQITELAQLGGISEDDPFTVRIRDTDSQTSLLISAVVGSARPAIHKVELV
ncbi:protein kinase family protein [Aspergillus undulatus]|uniref:protein kinase family protein n=1 Tax=Aspergillus undulatus TaxID=1810928 RepID=UPI003CCE50EA